VNTDNYCSGCQGHRGFVDAWRAVRDQVVGEVERARIANRGFTVVTTGHSLGGALSHFAGLELRRLNISVDMVSFTLCLSNTKPKWPFTNISE
jgi:Lipase (class 3)